MTAVPGVAQLTQIGGLEQPPVFNHPCNYELVHIKGGILNILNESYFLLEGANAIVSPGPVLKTMPGESAPNQLTE